MSSTVGYIYLNVDAKWQYRVFLEKIQIVQRGKKGISRLPVLMSLCVATVTPCARWCINV